jgi:hypothetical protein
MEARVMSRKPFVLAVSFVLLTGECRHEISEGEISGTTAERVAAVKRVIESSAAVPSTIDDAHLFELQFGDGQLGPSDFRSYIWIKVSADNIAKWKSVLKTSPYDPPAYDTPPSEPKWWLTRDEFEQLTKFDTFAMFQRHGWIVVDGDGNIFARTYTQ